MLKKNDLYKGDSSDPVCRPLQSARTGLPVIPCPYESGATIKCSLPWWSKSPFASSARDKIGHRSKLVGGCVHKTSRKRKRLEDRMARGKVQMRRIENPVHRQVTFCKRRMGLLKKAKELSVLCDANIGVIVISPHGKIYDLATNGNMQGLIERYRRTYSEMHGESSNHNKTQIIKQEVLALTHEIDLLQKGFRYMHGENGENGENDINHMNLDELQTLENNLEMWVNNIRSQKMQIISREIEMLRNKEAMLQAVNGVLQERIIEQNGIINFSHTAMTPQAPFPLTMERNYYL